MPLLASFYLFRSIFQRENKERKEVKDNLDSMEKG